MMRFEEKRLELQAILEELLGSRNVYFEPPTGFKMEYPCIVYERSSIDVVPADDTKYLKSYSFTLTTIVQDADSDLPDRVLDLPYCRYDRSFVNERLHHDAFTISFR